MPVLYESGSFNVIQIHPRILASLSFIKEITLYSIFSEKFTLFLSPVMSESLYCQ